MPVISFGCFSDDLSNREEYPTLLRMTGSFRQVGVFLRSVMTYFKWMRITLVIGPESAWLRAAEDLLVCSNSGAPLDVNRKGSCPSPPISPFLFFPLLFFQILL